MENYICSEIKEVPTKIYVKSMLFEKNKIIKASKT